MARKPRVTVQQRLGDLIRFAENNGLVADGKPYITNIKETAKTLNCRRNQLQRLVAKGYLVEKERIGKVKSYFIEKTLIKKPTKRHQKIADAEIFKRLVDLGHRDTHQQLFFSNVDATALLIDVNQARLRTFIKLALASGDLETITPGAPSKPASYRIIVKAPTPPSTATSALLEKIKNLRAQKIKEFEDGVLEIVAERRTKLTALTKEAQAIMTELDLIMRSVTNEVLPVNPDLLHIVDKSGVVVGSVRSLAEQKNLCKKRK